MPGYGRKFYKLLRVRKNGTLGSLFINKRAVLHQYGWMKAEYHPTKGFQGRIGWHALGHPKAPHLSTKGRKWFVVRLYKPVKFLRPKAQGGAWYLSEWLRIEEPVNVN